ncbi:MAG: endo-1,4-beta-xylanase [Chloroflexi bacterium]|nr:endo-1,4-beta-xylanase [Chloroflexota bacterium]
MLDNPGYKNLVLESANRLFISGELNTTWVFSEFRKSDWDRILSDWDNIKAQLDKQKLPTGFKYNWKASQDLIDFAIDNGLQVRGGNLIFDDDVPQGFWAYSPDEAKKLLEFIVKTRVIKFGASVNIWNIASEMVARAMYNSGFYTGEKLDAITSTQLTAQFAKEVDPEIQLAYVEDFVFENFPSPPFHNDYFKFIDRLQELGVPVDVLIIENNLWVRSPIDREKINLVFGEAKERNLSIEGGETTIALSSIYPGWPNRPPEEYPDDQDLLFIQADMAAELKQIYRENGVTSFGFGAMDDITGWQARIGYPDSRSTLSPNYAGERKPIWYSFMAASLNDFK